VVVDDLIDQFDANIDQIVSYCNAHHLKISLHIQLEGADRSFILGFDRPTTIHRLARLGAEFYIHTEKLRCLHSYEPLC
jgi:hypothetical protein